MNTERPIIEPAVMADEWQSLIEQIYAVADVASHIQIDVMDGKLVPSFSFPYNKTILDGTSLPFSQNINLAAHLMVQHPHEVGNRFIDAGVQRVVAQIEGFREGEAPRVCKDWHERGVEVGISLMLDTPLDTLESLMESGVISIIQVMSIARIGYQGEEFDARALVRIKELRAKYPDVTIAVDGGVNKETLDSVLDAGADMVGIGSAIMQQRNPENAFATLKDHVHSYAQRR